jgi:RNA polymerase sigma factor (sigma-70 family)
MHDARDEEDRRLLRTGEYTMLVEGYYGVILGRSRAGTKTEADAIAVAGEVVIRLLSELKRGRRYRVPFRVVVHKVIGWKLNEHFEPRKVSEVELEDWLDCASEDATSAIDPDAPFDDLVAPLTELEQEVLRLRYVDDLDFTAIAEQLGKEPNAVHQIHHRALTKLRRAA